ncbi:FAD-dependent monooxygenase [Krasilnikoviella flava]|uniref:2-polyprenyl-6-methoxyphenol hydroxylase n=1 Tax=Krasilnikoviella flava TaxID=526729 RepID=A0A1T5JKV8_9MICO|nr:FAD-dependent monooxygenase [Krasilnikoviella flava]SKC52080.1 2-polyprenyl-6-methoxyphenol hydroxylase [Krasilnikoviella flava]
MSKVLIVGAGIAGDALAVLLDRSGWEVDVVEIAPALRAGGQTVDLRGDSREVLQRLGLLEAALDATVEQRGLAWIDADERRRAEMPVEAFGGAGFVSSEELLRTDLARLLHGAVGPRTTHRFGDTIVGLAEAGEGVAVEFRERPPEVYDLVVGADGAHSRVRRLVFGPEEAFRRPLGLAHAWYTLRETPTTPGLDGWFLMLNLPGSRVVEARPGHPGEQEVGLTFPVDVLPPRDDAEARFALLERTFAGAGWRTAELLAAARAADDFALDTYDQIRMDAWSRGRVVLLGDSAWCASPLSGLGTALALRGAATLADALGARLPDDVAGALAAYESAMRPVTVRAQAMYPGRVRSFAPRTRLGIAAMTGVMRLVQRGPVATFLTRHVGDYGQAPEAAPTRPVTTGR